VFILLIDSISKKDKINNYTKDLNFIFTYILSTKHCHLLTNVDKDLTMAAISSTRVAVGGDNEALLFL
jgi:hypothetical protein